MIGSVCSRNCFFMKSPSLEISWTTYFDPMRGMSWLVTVLVMLVTAALMTLPNAVFKRFNCFSSDDEGLYSFGDAMFVAATSVSQQGGMQRMI